MMWDRVVSASLPELVITLVLTAGVYLAIVLYARLTGLRSFSKMSTSDFAMTVAVGSVLASAADPTRSLPVMLVALATLFGGQWLLSLVRVRWHGSQRLLDNRPLLLVANGEILEDNLSRARVATDDLRAKLREANVLNLGQVRAVVFETTGDISVVHSTDREAELDPDLFRDVRQSSRLRAGDAGAGGSTGPMT